MNYPWPVILDRLSDRYQILGSVDLINACTNPGRMYQQLKALYRPHYRANERILVYHYDTDYYLDKKSTGFGLYNFLTALHDLDIGPGFCILITNHYGIEFEINQYYQRYLPTHNQVHDQICVFESNHSELLGTPTPQENNLEAEKIQYPFICLGGGQRSHRIMFLSLLAECGVLNQGLVSWLSPRTKKSVEINEQLPDTAVQLLTTWPGSRIRDWQVTDLKHQEILNKHSTLFVNDYKNDIIPDMSGAGLYIEPVKEALVHVSLETVFDYPYPFITEKTFRPILMKRPFVVVGAAGCIEQVQKLGFKTFNDFWDERYDSIIDPTDRLNAVTKIVESICSLSIDQLKEMCFNMQAILDYNFDFYVNRYAGTDLEQQLQTL